MRQVLSMYRYIKNMFYVCSGTETEKEVKESEENLNDLYQLAKSGLLGKKAVVHVSYSGAGRYEKSRIPGQLWNGHAYRRREDCHTC